MKKLFMMVALSLVMVACNKEEDNDLLAGWDKIIAEMEETEMSALDVLNSLQDNEFWESYFHVAYYNKDGEVIEVVHQHEGGLIIPEVRFRFENNVMYYISSEDGNSGLYDAKAVNDNHIEFFYKEKPAWEWKIAAYDENKVLLEYYPKEEQTPNLVDGKIFLYSKYIYIRKVSPTIWWKTAIPDEE